jgi:3-hydroxymyristoyl/3-hydroxydecanoyl-(acyl carrier protein) dehydratase
MLPMLPKMSERFRAFSFVDRITQASSHTIEGEYTVPAAVRFPASLMAEAVGQLAAWAAMANCRFAVRPVAGLAGSTVFHRTVAPGQTLNLSATLERCDEEAVAYHGQALIDGHLALQLNDCVGPMLPMEDFDAPDAVRADFELLRTTGAAPGRFGGVPAPQIEMLEHAAGERLRARLAVPEREAAPYFDDHFPRRPVFPGTLLLDALSGLAVRVAREAMAASPAVELAPRRVSDVKIRAFTAPGSTLELAVERVDSNSDGVRLKVAARSEGRVSASAGIEVARPGSLDS